MSKIGKNIGDSVLNSVNNSAWDPVEDSVWNSVQCTDYIPIEDSVWVSVWDPINSHIKEIMERGNELKSQTQNDFFIS